MVATSGLYCCAFCSRPISGYFHRWHDGVIACDSCSRTLPECRVCRMPLAAVESGDVCRHCANTLPACARCGSAIHGKYWSFEGRSDRYCEWCWQAAPRCSACNLFADSGERYGERLFCRTCVQRLPRCAVCREPLHGRYWTHGDDAMFCDTCEHHRPHCVSCNAPVEYAAWEFEQQRHLCSRCRPQALLEQSAAEAIYRDVRARLARGLGISLRNEPAFKLLTYRQMQKLSSDLDDEPVSFVPAGKYVQIGNERTIYVQRGQHTQTAMAVIAHEIAHAWQSEQCGPGTRLTPLLSEGFAEWVAYRLLDEVRGRAQQEIMRTQDNIYGKGLRYYLDLERRSGRRAVFAAACGK